jgi:hypothetical protein
MCFSLSKGSDFLHTDIVKRLRTGDGVKMTENGAMAGKTAQMLHAPLVRDERWVEKLKAFNSWKFCLLFRLYVLGDLEGITLSGFEVSE